MQKVLGLSPAVLDRCSERDIGYYHAGLCGPTGPLQQTGKLKFVKRMVQCECLLPAGDFLSPCR